MGYGLIAVLFCVWSYALVDPNLVLSQWQPYWQAQTWLWEHVWKQKPLLVGSYVAIITIWFGLFVSGLQQVKANQRSKSWLLANLLLLSFIVVMSQNALSHDLFNYTFNAKMVLEYKTDPHVHTALEFPEDPWTRFMHNTHTTAPYGYGWTALSLVPAVLGNNVFTLTWLLFKAFNVLAAILLYFLLEKLSLQISKRSLSLVEIAVVFLNPLFLIEIFANGHNDLWMMVPALAAASLLLHFREKRLFLSLLLAIIIWAVSLSTKFATLTLLPIWVLLFTSPWLDQSIKQFKLAGTWIEKWLHWSLHNWPLLASLCMFLPLFTSRAQQFHPWYLTWVLVWLPLIKQQWWRNLIIAFSFSSLLRYVPWLLSGEFSPVIVTQQKIITWGIPLIWLIMSVWYGKKTIAK